MGDTNWEHQGAGIHLYRSNSYVPAYTGLDASDFVCFGTVSLVYIFLSVNAPLDHISKHVSEYSSSVDIK